MTIRVTLQLTGVDGKTCLVGKGSNTKSLSRTINMRLTKVITLQSNQVKHTPQDYINEFIIIILNPLRRFKNAIVN